MILWYDLETTGTDEEKDSILEIGFVLTDDDMEVKAEGQLVVSHGLAVEHLRDHANQVVREMHDDNGLWKECALPGLNLREVEQAVLDVLQDYGDVQGAGSGVSHFDRRFLATQMPLLHERLTHWSLDVGTVRRFFDLAGVPRLKRSNPEGRAHRGLDDARGALEQWNYYTDLVSGD